MKQLGFGYKRVDLGNWRQQDIPNQAPQEFQSVQKQNLSE